MHVHESGQVDNEAESEEDAFDQIKRFLSYLPNTTSEVAPRVETGDPPDRRPEELLNIIPPNRKRGYNARTLLSHVVDNGEFFEMRRPYAGALITAFARLDGYPVGVLASDPMKLAGAMDGDVADKYTHFVDLCDTFNLPLVIFLDMPGFMLRLPRRTQGDHAAGRARPHRQRRGGRPQDRVQRAQVLWRRRRRAQQRGPPLRTQPALRLARGRVGRHPHRGRRWPLPTAARSRAATDPDAHREAIEERLLRLRSPFRAAHRGDVIDLIDPRDTRRVACTFVKLAQPALARLASRPKRAVRP